MVILKDTIVAITPEQLKVINRDLNDYVYCLEKLAILAEENRLSDSIIAYQKRQINDYQQVVEAQTLKYVSLENAYNEIDNNCKQYKKNSKRRIIGVGVGGVISGIIVGVLII